MHPEGRRMCQWSIPSVIAKLLRDGSPQVPSLAKACLVSIGLLLIQLPAQAQSCESLRAARNRIGAEHDIAVARRKSLSNAPNSQWCQAARYEDALLDKWNDAYRRVASCMCNAGYCEGLMEEYARNVANAEKNKAITSKYCD